VIVAWFPRTVTIDRIFTTRRRVQDRHDPEMLLLRPTFIDESGRSAQTGIHNQQADSKVERV